MPVLLNFSALFGGIGRALSNPMYRRFWTSNAVSTIGRNMHRTGVMWLTWELTESTGWLGIIAFADIFPMVVFSLIGGAISDRVGYLRVMRVSQITTAMTAALFAALILSGIITIEMVLALSVVYGSTEAISTPPRMSAVHSMVPRADLSAAIALGSATFNGARLIGPAIAGALIVWFDTGVVIAVGALGFFQFYVVLLFIRIDEPERDRKASFDMIGDIRSSVAYALAHRGIRFLMFLLGVTGLLIRPFMELLPGFADKVFGYGPDGMAILLSSIGLGAMFAGLWLAQRGETRGLTRFSTTSVLVCALALVAFTISGNLWIGAGFLVAVGFAMLMGGVSSQTLIQNTVESSMRARVLSLFILISWGLPAFGAVAAGWLAEIFGLQVTIAGGAILAFVIWLWARRAVPGLAPGLERVDAT